MPQIKSAKKTMRTSEKAAKRNKSLRNKIITFRRKLEQTSGDEKTQAMKEYFSVLDKAVKKGVIKRGTANRRKARVSKKR